MVKLEALRKNANEMETLQMQVQPNWLSDRREFNSLEAGALVPTSLPESLLAGVAGRSEQIEGLSEVYPMKRLGKQKLWPTGSVI